jgi:hypothetical protein
MPQTLDMAPRRFGDDMLRSVRFLNSLANFVLVFSVIGSTTQTYAFADGAATGGCCSAQAVAAQSVRAIRLPAEAVASRDGARVKVAARPVQFHTGALIVRVVPDALDLSSAFLRSPGAPGQSASLSSTPVRAPPVSA